MSRRLLKSDSRIKDRSPVEVWDRGAQQRSGSTVQAHSSIQFAVLLQAELHLWLRLSVAVPIDRVVCDSSGPHPGHVIPKPKILIMIRLAKQVGVLLLKMQTITSERSCHGSLQFNDKRAC